MTDTITPATLLHRNPDLEAVEMDGELVMMDAGSGQYFGLNPLGRFIWNALETPTSADDVIGGIKATFETSPDDDVDTDVLAFLESLRSDKLILLVPAT